MLGGKGSPQKTTVQYTQNVGDEDSKSSVSQEKW